MRNIVTNVHISVLMYSTRYSCTILMDLESFRQISEKYSNMKFHENPSSGSRVVPCGNTDGETDMTKLLSRLSQFCER
jgi:hypothetical protein